MANQKLLSLLLLFSIGLQGLLAHQLPPSGNRFAEYETRQRRDADDLPTIAVRPGESLESIKGSIAFDYNVNMQMRVENRLKYDLIQPKAYPWYGFVSNPPPTVRPCYVEALATHKRGHTATGTSGIVSWFVEGLQTTIVIFWSLPYSFGCNQLSIGTFPGNNSGINEGSKDWWIDYMYNGANDNAGNVTWSDYCSTVRTICQQSGEMEVCGTIGTSSTSTASITVKPTTLENLATENQCRGN